MKQLTQHFSLSEMTANGHNLPNVPNEVQIKALKDLCENVLEPARNALGYPLIINSGFRSVELNEAVGGVANSQHIKGEAADVFCENTRELFYYIMKNLPFDQLIWEKGSAMQPAWVHVSFCHSYNRHSVIFVRK